MSNNEWHEHHLCGVLPPEVAEDLIKCYPDDGSLSYEEIRIQQESLYFSFQKHGKNQLASLEHGETSHSNPFTADAASQLALDEALARSLQIADGFDDIYTFAGASESPHIEQPVRVEIPNAAVHGFDPDDTSYEALQSLGDAIGHESRGLTDEEISRLPTFKYKTGLFFRKKKNEVDECVICCSQYAFRDKLTSLPCIHMFHSKCVMRWLKEKKSCPVCNMEVRGD